MRVWDGATLTAPVLAEAQDVTVGVGATLNAPVLAQAQDVTGGSTFSPIDPQTTTTGDAP